MLSAWFEIEDSSVSVAISDILFFETVAAITTSATTVMITTGSMYVRSLVLIFLFFFFTEAFADVFASFSLIFSSPVQKGIVK